ncbi:MAG: cupredoxin domain-containing protein [Chloroflexi bacterium]|nr:cupredoxin domain-containing protein [Chloroflexota bacterium]
MKRAAIARTACLSMALVLALLAFASCREAAPPPLPPPPVPPPPPALPPAPPPPPPPGTREALIDLSAKNISFDRKTLTVPAGAKVTMTFTNNETFVFHNFALYESSAATQVLFKGDFTQAGTTSTYMFTAPSQPGTYFFRCDVHPTLMTGEFVVEAAGGGN